MIYANIHKDYQEWVQ